MPKTPIQSIREYCLGCCLEDANEVKLCPDDECPLHPYRLGKNPNIKKRELTEEQKAAASERLKAARKAKLAKNTVA